jgi:formylglycine-generating enzyme required for sulfatase activity
MKIKNWFYLCIALVLCPLLAGVVIDRAHFAVVSSATAGVVVVVTARNDRCGGRRSRYACTKFSATLRYEARGSSYFIDVSAGRVRGHDQPVSLSDYRVGQHEKVSYNPRKPSEAYRNTFWDIWGEPVGIFFLQICAFLGAIGNKPVGAIRPLTPKPARPSPPRQWPLGMPLLAITALVTFAVAATTVLVGSNSPPTPEPEPARLPLTRFSDRLQYGSAGPLMIVIPAGTLLMGSPGTEVGRNVDEGPQHQVTIAAFALAMNETTFADYERFQEGTRRRQAHDASWGGGTRPAINVSWHDATSYAQWLSDQTGRRYRLPTEAEWEYAARAGSLTPYSTGECIATPQANFNGNEASSSCPGPALYPQKTQPVASYPGNAFGLHDMHGNAYEWVQDCYHASYVAAPGDGRPWLEEDHGDCTRRVLRGGSWDSVARGVRSAIRASSAAGATGDFIGFRLARDL